jgi:hypothetical protein
MGMSESDYHKYTYELTTNFANTFLEQNPVSRFIYVSGAGTDSSEKGKIMWARVKGKTENAIFNMGFKNAYAFRPGMILPEKGVKSKVKLYNFLYLVFSPFNFLFRKMKSVTTSSRLGQAMINAVLKGSNKLHLENEDINLLAKA